MKKATFAQRLSAYLLDIVFSLLISFVINFVLALTIILAPITPITSIIFPLLYGFILTGWKSTTYGKMTVGIKVVNEKGGKVSWGEALLREIVGKSIAVLFIYPLGYLWMLWDKDEQTWHDKIAKTFVVTSK